jgi:gliding motility-associated-like protein
LNKIIFADSVEGQSEVVYKHYPKRDAMKRFLLSFVCLLSLLFVFSGPEAYAQGREGGKGGELPPVLKGQRNDTIPDLESYYCSEGAPDDIFVDPALIPSGTVRIEWTVYTQTGPSNYEEHAGWVDDIGTAPENGIRFFPTRVDPAFYDIFILISYRFWDGMGYIGTTNYDYAMVRKTPDVFNFGITQGICFGQTADLTLSSSETGINYYLYRDGVLLDPLAPPKQGNGNPIVFSDTPAALGTYQYTVQAERETGGIACETWMNGAPEVTVYPSPTSTPLSRPVSGTSGDPFCEGLPFELYDGNPAVLGYVYTWTGPGLDAAGETGHTVTVNDPVILNNATTHQYTLTIADENNPTSCEASATVDVTIQENPAATPSINPTAVCEGKPIDVIANATGGAGSYSYAWSTLDNPSFSSVDQATILIDPTTLADDGDVYTVVVTDALGCQSAAADAPALGVNEKPEVTITGPTEVCEGNPANYTANVTGSGTYNYQWQLDGTDIAGATSSTLSYDATSLPSIGNHTVSVIVTDVANSTNCSATASTSLDVYDTPEVSIDEGDQEVCESSPVTFTSSVTGSGTYVYEWSIGGTVLTGETGSVLNVDASSLPTAGTYTVSVTVTDTDSPQNCSETASVQLTVNDVPEVTITGPTEVCFGVTAEFIATTSGSGTYNYQWQLDGIDIVGATSSTLSFDTSTLPSSGNYDISVDVVDVSNVTNCAGSENVILVVNELPTVILDDAATCDEDPVYLTVSPSGGGAPYVNYTLYDATDNEIDNWAANTVSLSGTYVELLNDGATYRVRVEDSNGCIGTSNDMTLTVNENPTVEIQYEGNPETAIDVCVGSSMTLDAQGSDGTGIYTYEWRLPDNSTQAGSQLIIGPVEPTDGGDYEVTVDDGNCQVTTTINVVVNELPEVVLPAAYAVCEGTQNHEISATITNGTAPYNVVWEFDDGSGAPITTPGNETYTISAVTEANEGIYTVIVTDDNGCESVQDDLVLTVNPAPTVSFNASSVNEVCDGTQVTLIAVGDGGSVSGSNPSDYGYVWSHEGTVVPGVSTATYQFAGDNGVNDGLYEVMAVDDNGSGCESPLASIDVTVHELPDATLDVDPAFFIEGTEVTFTAVTGYTSYEFEVNGTNVQGPVVDNTYVTSTLVDQDEVTVIVREDHGTVQCENSSTVTMTVFDSVDKPVVNTTNEEYCQGDGGATVTVTNPQQDVTYELIYAPDGAEVGYGSITYDGTNTVSWSNVLDDNGGTSTPTSFEVKAYWSAIPTEYQLSDAFDITEHPVPTVHTMSVDGASAAGGITETDCNAGTGYTIGLFDGHEAVVYTLLLNGNQVLEQKSGAGVISSFTFDNNYAFIGTYTIVAENTNGCTTDMIGSFTIDGTAVTVFDLTGDNGGQYCDGSTGAELTLSGSESGVDYELFRDGASQGTFTGDGNALSLGTYTDEGQYSVQVTTSGGCIYPMNGVVDVEMIPTPDAGNLTATNSGEYCAGGSGVDITLEITQEDGVTYELFDVATGTLIGTAGPGVAGNGDITFETGFTTEGTYQVRALAGAIACPALSNEIEVVANPLPVIDNVQQFTDLCVGGTGYIGIENSESNVEYRWVDFNNNSNTGSWISGNGSRLQLPVTFAGEYLIEAQNTGTGCLVNMNGTVTVTEEPLPVDVAVTSTGGTTGCDDPVVITIDNPEVDIEYQLYVDDGGSLVSYHNGGPLSSSDGSAITFDPIIASSTDFVVVATNPTTQCPLELTDVITVNISGAIQPQVLEPESGDICNGDLGIQFELRDSELGVEYGLIRAGATPTADVEKQRLPGNDGRLTFDPVLEEGEYYVMGYPTDPSCEIEMANRVDLIVHPLPKAFNMIGPGTYCGSTGATLGIDNSEEGFSYILQQHSPLGKNIIETKVGIAGGDTIQFDRSLTVELSGNNIYSVVAISDKGCTSSMKDSIEVEVKSDLDTPVIIDNVGVVDDTVYFCNIPGEFYTIELDSPQMDEGVVYQVLDDTESIVAETIVESGTMDPLNVVDPGTYTVRSSWADGACITASDTIRVEGTDPAEDMFEPIYPSRICYGDTASIKYPDNEFGWTYTFMEILESGDVELTSIPRDTISSASASDTIVWKIAKAGKYYISIQSESGVCSASPTATIQIDIADEISMPDFTDDNYYYCYNDNRVEIEISDVASAGSYVYRLIDVDGNTYGAVFNDDANLVFAPVVGEDTPASYGLIARDLDTGCEIVMDEDDFVSVEQYRKPLAFDVEPETAEIDPTSEAVTIELSGSESGVKYDLYFENETVARSTIDGDANGDPISFNSQFSGDIGTYYVFAKIDGVPCESIEMNNSVTINEESLKIIEYDLIDNKTDYCVGDNIGFVIEESQEGVSYQLHRRIGNSDWVPVSYPQIGDGRDLNFWDSQEEYFPLDFESGGNSELPFEYKIVGTKDDEVEVMFPLSGNQVNMWKAPEVKTLSMTSSIGEPNQGGQCTVDEMLLISINGRDPGVWYRLEYLLPEEFNSQDKEYKTIQTLNTGHEFEVDTAGYYRVVAYNIGCLDEVDMDTLFHVYPYDSIAAEDYVIRMSESEYKASIDLLEKTHLDSRLDTTDYQFYIDYSSNYFEDRFLFVDEDEFDTDGSPFVEYSRPVDFIGIDSMIYTISNRRCKDRIIPSNGKVTVIVGNEKLPDGLDILIPNAFSPNDDGMNETFVIRGIDKIDQYPESQESKLMVFNRWGNLVYESKGTKYGVDTEWWDGTTNVSNMVSIGQDLPNGVYFYIFSIVVATEDGPRTKEYNGYIELRR